jgi:hypothetical protein
MKAEINGQIAETLRNQAERVAPTAHDRIRSLALKTAEHGKSVPTEPPGKRQRSGNRRCSETEAKMCKVQILTPLA